jgi:1-acyl-sn-glycerol-3-phosphate acyltransferase
MNLETDLHSEPDRPGNPGAGAVAEEDLASAPPGAAQAIPYLPRRPVDRAHALVLALLVPLALGFLLWGILVAALLFRLLPPAGGNALILFWSRITLVALGIRLETDALPPEARGTPGGKPGALLLMNHVSWADVFVVAAVAPARFVAKSEIRAWPLAGWLARAVGTLFIERGRRHAVAHINRQAAQRLRAGQSIGIFPEGTTTDGTRLLRFHANLVQAALEAQAPVVPVALQYWQDDAPSRAAAYIGDMNIAESMLRILIAPRLRVRLRFLPAVPCAGATRQAIAQQAHEAVRAALVLPPTDGTPAPVAGRAAPDAAPS